jgi:hypothetical protein
MPTTLLKVRNLPGDILVKTLLMMDSIVNYNQWRKGRMGEGRLKSEGTIFHEADKGEWEIITPCYSVKTPCNSGVKNSTCM